MTNQLVLLEHRPSWALDATTRERGRRGVAAARAVLRESNTRARAAQIAEDGGASADASPSPLAPAA